MARRIGNEGILMMVTLEARTMTMVTLEAKDDDKDE